MGNEKLLGQLDPKKNDVVRKSNQRRIRAILWCNISSSGNIFTIVSTVHYIAGCVLITCFPNTVHVSVFIHAIIYKQPIFFLPDTRSRP